MSRNRRNGYEERTPYMRGSRNNARARARYDDYEDEDYSGYEEAGYSNENYDDDDIPHTTNYEYDDAFGRGYGGGDEYYDDEDYEDYGELGSNYDTEDDPNYGYDNYDDYYAEQDTSKSSRANDYVNNIGIMSAAGRRSNLNMSRSNANQRDLNKYLDYLEKYDRGEINNYEMSKIQRKYANNPFWDTFQPSSDLINKYGRGNKSTRWPMFKQVGGQWRPEVWRND